MAIKPKEQDINTKLKSLQTKMYNNLIVQGISGLITNDTLNNYADKILLIKVDRVKTFSGVIIAAYHSIRALINHYKIDGKSTQNGTPTLDTTIPIKSTGDNGIIPITIHGKNLLSFNSLTSKVINGITITNNQDGSITFNGTASAEVSFRLSDNMENLKAGQYYVSKNLSGTASGQVSNILYGNNGTTISLGNMTGAGLSIHPLIDYKTYYLYFYIAPGITLTNYTLKPMLESGNANTNYEPYKKVVNYNIALATDKNKFDKTKITQGYYLDLNNGNLIANSQYCISDFIEVTAGETWFLPKRNTTRTKFFNENKKVLGTGSDVADGDVSFIVPNGVKYIRFSIMNNNTVTPASNINIDTFQFEKGPRATEYVDYSKSIPFRGLPDGTTDKIDNDIGKLIRNVGKIMLDGSGTWLCSQSTGNPDYYYGYTSYYDSLIKPPKFDAEINQLCDKLDVKGGMTTNSIVTRSSLGHAGPTSPTYFTRLLMLKTVIDSAMGATLAERWKNYLSNNPITFTYPLATPYEEVITSQILVSLDDTTTIDTTDPIGFTNQTADIKVSQ